MRDSGHHLVIIIQRWEKERLEVTSGGGADEGEAEVGAEADGGARADAKEETCQMESCWHTTLSKLWSRMRRLALSFSNNKGRPEGETTSTLKVKLDILREALAIVQCQRAEYSCLCEEATMEISRHRTKGQGVV